MRQNDIPNATLKKKSEKREKELNEDKKKTGKAASVYVYSKSYCYSHPYWMLMYVFCTRVRCVPV